MKELHNSLSLAQMEIKSSIRNKTFMLMSVILWSLLLVSFAGGFSNYQQNLKTQLHSQNIVDQEWSHQTRHPHAAAHWGTYLFKSFPFISIYDSGLTPYTGSYYRVEAHKQHQVNAVNLADKEAFMRMNELNVAMTFQLFMPLLIIMLSFSAISRERESKTLLLLQAQGLTAKQLIWGKFLAHYTIILLLTLPVFILMLFTLYFDAGPQPQLARLILLFIIYALYFFILLAIVILISTFSHSSRSSLITCLSIWVVFIILLPKMVTGVADRKYPLPSSYQFEHDVKEGFDKGMGNDGNYTERSEAYLKTFLTKYQVDSTNQLPKNVAFGLDLLQSERYNNKVYQYYTTHLEEKIKQQQQLTDLAGFVNPLIAVRQLSMGFAGTDFHHHMDFYNHARQFRNNFNEILNKRILEYGNHHKSEFFKESELFYKQMNKFQYSYPTVKWILRAHHLAVLSLFIWIIITAIFIQIAHRIAFKIR